MNSNRDGVSGNRGVANMKCDSYCSASYWNKNIIEKRVAILTEAIRRSRSVISGISNSKSDSDIAKGGMSQIQCAAVQDSNMVSLGQLYISLIQNLTVHDRDSARMTIVLGEACEVLPLHMELRLLRVSHHRYSVDTSGMYMCVVCICVF